MQNDPRRLAIEMLCESASPALRAEMKRARLFASQRDPIHISGPTGSGKSLLWQFILEHSARSRSRSFSVVLSTVQDTVAPSELFGHRRGSFTGASANRAGLCKQANGGTLFLDEINKTTLELQGRLLELVEHGRIRAVGSDEVETVDCRVVAASNVDLREAVAKGSFLEDLRHRLSILPLQLPALRERQEDMPQLVKTILGHLARTRVLSLAAPTLTDCGMRLMQEYDWPGNIRQLDAVLRRLFVLSDGAPIISEDLVAGELARERSASQPTGPGRNVEAPISTRRRRTFSLAQLRAAIADHGGNMTAAAGALKINRTHLYEILRRLESREA